MNHHIRLVHLFVVYIAIVGKMVAAYMTLRLMVAADDVKSIHCLWKQSGKNNLVVNNFLFRDSVTR